MTDRQCPACAETGHDAQGNHLFQLKDGVTWYCNREQHHLSGKPYIEGNMNQESIVERTQKPCTKSSLGMSTIALLSSADLLERKLSKATLEHFGVKVGYDEETRAIKEVCFPVHINGVLTGYHVKLPQEQDPKRKYFKVGETAKADFGGQDLCESFKKLFIFEGGEDALSVSQVLHAKYGYRPSVVWLSGSDQLSRLDAQSGFLDKFSEVILCLDNDAAGEKATNKILELHPTYKTWSISGNDASDMLQQDKSAELINALFNAKVSPPDSIVTVDDAFEEACTLPAWGRLWPWPSLNRLTYGRRGGEGIYVGSAVKAGKTEWKNQMIEHIITTEGKKVFVCSFEQSPGIVVKAVAGKLKHKQFHNPEHVDQGKFTQQELTEAVTELKGKMIMFRASFSDVGVGNMWDRMKPAIRHASIVEGVTDFFIDPITQLTDGMTPSETETELRRFSNEIQGMAQELGFFYYCFAHLKEPPQGKTHEEGGAIKVAQFRGSRAMAEKTKFMLGIIRNQFSDDVSERNTSTQHLLLNSGFGKSGKFDTWYDEETGSYLEPKREFV